MDVNALVLLATSIAFVILVGLLVWAGVARMRGHPSRFDHIAETLIRAQAREVYPPSLRVDPEPAVVEEIEVSRATNATRDTPGDSLTNPPAE